MSFWTAPEIWPGQTVFIIGGGPSLLGMDLSPIHKRRVIGVNQAYELGPWVDVLFFGDFRWWRWNEDDIAERFGGLIVSCAKAGHLHGIPRIKMLARSNGHGIWTGAKNRVAWNLNTGGAAINLAVHFGAKRIVLVAFDMKQDQEKGLNGGNNWHGKHGRFNTPKADIYEAKFLPTFEYIKKDLDELGIECVNATPNSELETFPLTSLEEETCLDLSLAS